MEAEEGLICRLGSDAQAANGLDGKSGWTRCIAGMLKKSWVLQVLRLI